MSEALFQRLFDRHGKSAFLFKMTDTTEVNSMNRNTRSPKVKVKAQPSDYIVTLDGETFFAEVKSSMEEISFPFSNIRPTQVGFARQILAAKGKYFFFILRTRTGEWFRVPAKAILDHDKQSFKWTELQPYRM